MGDPFCFALFGTRLFVDLQVFLPKARPGLKLGIEPPQHGIGFGFLVWVKQRKVCYPLVGGLDWIWRIWGVPAQGIVFETSFIPQLFSFPSPPKGIPLRLPSTHSKASNPKSPFGHSPILPKLPRKKIPFLQRPGRPNHRFGGASSHRSQLRRS